MARRPSNQPEPVQITTRIPAELGQQLADIARRERRSMSSLLNFAVEDWLEKRRATQPVEA